MPEDVIFVPLGFTYQILQGYYKGSDPEWPSFITFRRDRGKDKAVRSTWLWIPYFVNLIPNHQTKELVDLVGSYFAGMKPMREGLGVPVKVRNIWLDVLIPHGPPREHECSGYARRPLVH